MPYLIEIANDPPLVVLRHGEWDSFDAIRAQDLSINWPAARSCTTWNRLVDVPVPLQKWYRLLVEEFSNRLYLCENGSVWTTAVSPDGVRWATKPVRFHANMTYLYDFAIREV